MKNKTAHGFPECLSYSVVIEKRLHDKECFLRACGRKRIHEFVVDNIHFSAVAARLHDKVGDRFERQRQARHLGRRFHLYAEHFVFWRLFQIESNGLQIFPLHGRALFLFGAACHGFSKVELKIRDIAHIFQTKFNCPSFLYPSIKVLESRMPRATHY